MIEIIAGCVAVFLPEILPEWLPALPETLPTVREPAVATAAGARQAIGAARRKTRPEPGSRLRGLGLGKALRLWPEILPEVLPKLLPFLPMILPAGCVVGDIAGRAGGSVGTAFGSGACRTGVGTLHESFRAANRAGKWAA